MNKKKIYFIFALCGLLSFTSCQNEEPLDAPVAKDAFALLPADTPVGIQAQLQGGFAQGESRTGTSTTATNWYAHMEIHPTKEVQYILYLPGASDPDKTSLRANDVSLESLQNTEPFSSLMLKDFNLTEGGDRCVTRWTALWAYNRGYDNLIGFARLKADAQGNPVLDFGELQHANTKITLVLQDEQGAPILVNDYNQVSAELSLQKSGIIPIYTPEGQTQGVRFTRSFDGLKTLQADDTIDPACFGWTVYAHNNIHTYSLYEMCNADDTEEYYGEQNNMLTAIVCPTPTHKDNNDNTFTLLEGGPQLTDAEVLTIEVNEDPDGDNGPLTTGKYTLKLKDVKLADGTNLTALKSGEHLTLTVTLQHNMLVQATATIGDWEVVSADVDLNQDPSKIPPYEYNAETKTYTVNEESYVKTVWGMKATDDKVMYDGMLVVDGSASTDALTSVINGAIAAGIKSYYVINELLCDEYGIPTLQTPILSLVGIVEGGNPDLNDPDIGTLSIVLADATQIPDWSFCECHALKSVSAPKATSVGNSAIRSCSGLEKVTLDAATTIGEFAFYNCTSLKELTFGSKITELGAKVFLWFNEDEEDYFSYTPNCALTLANGQKHMLEITPTNPISYPDVYPVTPADEDAEENRRIWADYTWKSITIK